MGEKRTESDNRVIRISVDGVEVVGWAGGNERNITVWIREPYVDMANALHCPWFDTRLFIGEHRAKTARRLLTDLYRVGLFLEQNSVALRAFYRWYCVNWKPGFRKSPRYRSFHSCEGKTVGEVGRYLNGELHGLSRLRVACTIAFKVNTGFWKAELNCDFLAEVMPESLTLPFASEYVIPRMIMGRRDLLSKKGRG